MKKNFYKSLVWFLSDHIITQPLFFKGNEYWVPVENTDAKYYVSSKGRLKSYKKNPDGVILRLFPTCKNYLLAFLCPTNQKRITRAIHRIVAVHFIDNPFNKPQINHIDGNKSNNSVSNLEWSTSKENIHHAIKTGLRAADINLRSQDMFTEEDISDIRNLIEQGLGNQEICKIYKCVHSTISKIRRGHHYPSDNKSPFDVWNDLSRANKILFDPETGLFYKNIKEAADAKTINHQVLRYQILYSVNKKTSIIYV